MNPLEERLVANIFCQPYASDGKINGVFQPAYRMPKSAAITKPILQVNGPRRIAYLNFDIDRMYGGLAWEDANLPPPNFVVINPANLHAHLLYELETPVWIPKKNNRRGEALPVRYLKAVQKSMGRALGADPDYNGLLVKNPLHDAWGVSYGRTQPYTLKELSAHLDLESSYTRRAMVIDKESGRRMILFNSGRCWAYREKTNYTSLDAFCLALRYELELINSSFEKGPETTSTIRSIAKSVSRYVWYHYDCKRRGIMNLDPTEALSVRQQKGQAFTSRLRSDKTINRIRNAILALQRDGVLITKSAIASRCNLHRSTVTRHWSNIIAYNENFSPTSSLTEKGTLNLTETLTLNDSLEDNLLSNGKVTLETVSRRDESPCPLRRGQPEGYTDTPNASLSYPELIEHFKDESLPLVKKVVYSRRLARERAIELANQGILVSGAPETLRTELLPLVDRGRNRGNYIEQRITQ